MRDIHVWHLLAVHIPNVLPRTFLSLHLPWLRKAARLIYATVLFTLGCVGASLVIRRPKRSNESPTWAQCVLGAMFVWFMFALGYGVIPHEWLTFGNSYLNFDSASFLLHKNRIVPFAITRDKAIDTGAVLIYAVVLTTNVKLFAAWQKRKVAEPAAEGAEPEPEPGPITGGSIFSRMRRAKRTSAFGRPVTTSES